MQGGPGGGQFVLQGAVFRDQGFRRPHRQSEGAVEFGHELPFGDPGGVGLRLPDRAEVTTQGLHLLYG